MGDYRATSYDRFACFLHWAVALLVVAASALGIWASNIGPNHPDRDVYEFRETLLFWHKSLGLTVLGLMLLRLVWALANRNARPPLPDHLPRHERFLAKSVHYGFYMLLLALPSSGIILSQSAGFEVSFFGLFTLPQIVPVDLSVSVPERVGVQLGVLVHKQVLAYLLYGMLSLHLLGVIKHHLIDRERGMIRRMWPGRG